MVLHRGLENRVGDMAPPGHGLTRHPGLTDLRCGACEQGLAIALDDIGHDLSRVHDVRGRGYRGEDEHRQHP